MTLLLTERLEGRRLLSAALESGVLTVTGTEAADSVTVRLDRNHTRATDDDQIVVSERTARTGASGDADPAGSSSKRDGRGGLGDAVATRFPAADVSSIAINLLGGNDSARIARKVTAPATIDGGAGDDRLIAGGGSTTLNGGEGNDWLRGGPAMDTFGVGDGDDRMRGARGGFDRVQRGEIESRGGRSDDAGGEHDVETGDDGVSGGGGAGDGGSSAGGDSAGQEGAGNGGGVGTNPTAGTDTGGWTGGSGWSAGDDLNHSDLNHDGGTGVLPPTISNEGNTSGMGSARDGAATTPTRGNANNEGAGQINSGDDRLGDDSSGEDGLSDDSSGEEQSGDGNSEEDATETRDGDPADANDDRPDGEMGAPDATGRGDSGRRDDGENDDSDQDSESRDGKHGDGENDDGEDAAHGGVVDGEGAGDRGGNSSRDGTFGDGDEVAVTRVFPVEGGAGFALPPGNASNASGR